MNNQAKTHKLPQRKIGNSTVPAIGIGLMGMSGFYKHGEDPVEAEKQHLEILTKAADSGVTFWDTSDLYGPYTNEELIGKWFKQTGRRKEIFLATKFGPMFDKTGHAPIRGDKGYVRQCIEGSLKRMQTDYVDLYQQGRVDKNVRIEETVEAMVELVKEGKVKYLGLSECSENTLRRAHKVHPISAVQFEYSMCSLEIEKEEIGIKKVCNELGIALIAYSPLGRGLLGGQLKSRNDLIEGDFRLSIPRFYDENLSKNLELVEKVEKFAKKKGCTPAQLALAWLLKQGDNVIPIPGARQMKHLEENLAAFSVNLTTEETKELREIAEQADIIGDRYPDFAMPTLFTDSI